MLSAYFKQIPLSTWLKILGIVTMTIDHIGMVFFPDQIAWRLVGRLALPIFLFGIVEGNRHTSSHGKYITRLLICGIISQPIFSAVADTTMLNICFSLALALGMLYWLDRVKGDLGRTMIVIATMMVAWLFNVDYGIYGVLFTLVLWIASQSSLFTSVSRKKQALAMVLLAAGFHLFVLVETQLVGLLGSARFGLRQTLAVVGVALIAYVAFVLPARPRKPRRTVVTTSDKIARGVSRYAFYAYYPLHLLVIGAVYSWMQ